MRAIQNLQTTPTLIGDIQVKNIDFFIFYKEKHARNGLKFGGAGEHLVVKGFKGVVDDKSRTLTMWIKTSDNAGQNVPNNLENIEKESKQINAAVRVQRYPTQPT